MEKIKLIQINLTAAKDLVRMLDRLEKAVCTECEGAYHVPGCPAREAFQLRNYLTQRINNPNKKFGI